MDGLKDYIEWLGDVDFSAKPLNETDAVILCLISYYDLAPAASEQPEEPDRPFCLHDCLDAINAGKLELRITGGEDGNLGVFRARLLSPTTSTASSRKTICNSRQ